MALKDTDDYVKLFDVGDILYKVTKDRIEKIEIREVRKYPHYVYTDNKNNSYFNHNIVKSCFRTEEEAMQELQRRNNIAKKKELLKEYERKLNEELKIGDHFIIK